MTDTTANQIAAGEVVERPASAVKELVENAIDAGARHIVVELEEGGKYLIRVTDDGSGMGTDDALLALQRHATSKISAADDLFRITTMGFRGEALPSIASVSQLSLVTRPADAAPDEPGTEVVVHGGRIVQAGSVGAPGGTRITVENLFYNVPARLKFLKTGSTELSHIVELVQRFALSYPEIAFDLRHHGHDVFSSPGAGSPMDACVRVFGRDVARHLVPIDYRSAGLAVTGFISTPNALKTTRSAQHTFVNKRFVRNKAVTRALDDAYKSIQTLHGTKYPVASLHIDIDPAEVDVNVSPTKTEVRFTREGDIYSAVRAAVKEALLAGGLVQDAPSKPLPMPASMPQPGEARAGAPFQIRQEDRPLGSREERAMTEAQERAARQPRLLPDLDDPFDDAGSYLTRPTSPASEITEYVAEPPSAALYASPAAQTDSTPPTRQTARQTDYRGRQPVRVRVLAQTRNMYILAQADDALLLIDQHIAHERVLYERLLAGAAASAVTTQRLVLPFTLELSRREALVIEGRLAELAQAGFELEPFGGDSFLVRAIPASVAQRRLKAQGDPESILREIVEDLVEKSASRRLGLPSEEVLISASCKMAVKAGDPMTQQEMEGLIADLFQCENPYACPHGRPILVEMSNVDLDRKFGR